MEFNVAYLTPFIGTEIFNIHVICFYLFFILSFKQGERLMSVAILFLLKKYINIWPGSVRILKSCGFVLQL